jgi:hypothetical protein
MSVPYPHADTITAANEAHVAKEKALSEVAALKLAAEKEHAAFEEEWRQLSHIIEDDRCAACRQPAWQLACCVNQDNACTVVADSFTQQRSSCSTADQ